MAPARGAHVGIVTVDGDFHADVVALRLRHSGHRATIVALDKVPGHGRLSWRDGARPDGAIAAASGERVRPGDFDTIWWRRNGSPAVPDAVSDPDARTVVARSAHTAAFGLFATAFTGAWVSHPDATAAAENKLVQLQAAHAAGFAVPRTLVSQEPEEIRSFVRQQGGRVIVKTVAGALGVPLGAGLVDEAALGDDDAIALCPTIYQEYVPGRRHLRVCAFGADVHTFVIESDNVDWRYTRGLPIHPFDLDAGTRKRVVRVLDLLGLRMGVFDLKLDEDERPVWLEVNPQGQFLFVEGQCGAPLAQAAADFLAAEVPG